MSRRRVNRRPRPSRSTVIRPALCNSLRWCEIVAGRMQLCILSPEQGSTGSAAICCSMAKRLGSASARLMAAIWSAVSSTVAFSGVWLVTHTVFHRRIRSSSDSEHGATGSRNSDRRGPDGSCCFSAMLPQCMEMPVAKLCLATSGRRSVAPSNRRALAVHRSCCLLETRISRPVAKSFVRCIIPRIDGASPCRCGRCFLCTE